MSRSGQESIAHRVWRRGLRVAFAALVGGAISAGTTGCMAALSIVPSMLSLAHAAATMKSDKKDDADARNDEAESASTEENSSAAKPTQVNLCQMIAVARPDVELVELRKGAAGAPEYRELHLINSGEDAHWTPVVDSASGADGWRPAVNFLKMDFKPPLTSAIPSSGSCYLAYAPAAADANNQTPASELNPVSGDALGTFSWGGRVFQYAVARTVPCLPPSS